MTTRGKDDEQSFISRWSQRKRAAEEEAQREAPAADDVAPEAAAEEPRPVDPADLPDVDSLDAGSDFTVFMRPGVPAALKQRALRRLWQVDPAFKHICMLDDYNLDYTDAATVVPNLKTIYQVGRGMVLDDEPPPEPAPERGGERPVEPVAAQEPAQALSAEAHEDSEAAAKEAAGEPPLESRQQDGDSEDRPASPVATPRGAGPADDPRRAGRSARRRRWGDSDAS